jgi:hypothetical protein
MTTFPPPKQPTPFSFNYMAVFGVTLLSATGSIIESLDIEMKSEFKQLIDSAGLHSEAKSYDRMYSISAKGKGDESPFAAGATFGTLTGISGKGFWTNSTVESKNDDFRGWSATATVYANAT